MQPKSQFSSGFSAHNGLSTRSLVAQFDEFDYSAQAMQPKSRFISGFSAHNSLNVRSPIAQYDKLDYSAQAMQPKSQISSGFLAHMVTAPEAQQLSMTSSTTLHRPCSLRVRSAHAIQPIRPQRQKPDSSILRTQLLNSTAQELLNSDAQLRRCRQEINSVHVEQREMLKQRQKW